MNPPTNLSLLLLTKNESERVRHNLDWIRDCPSINEIIVVDDFSTDDTVKTIKNIKFPPTLKLKIFTHHLGANFSAQRQFALSKATNKWIFWIDADEIPDTKLINFLNHFDPTSTQPYSFIRQDTFYGYQLKHGENGHSRIVRLFHHTCGHFVGQVHEVWQDDCEAINTGFILHHQPHANLKSLFEKINFYTDIRARELYQQKTKTNLFQIVFFPLAKFFQNYLFKLGFLDGTPGIIMAIAMSFHSFLVRAKLWHLYQK